VSWAGEEESANWFDTAREFTERWHHQQQIRLAVNKPGIVTREFYFPVLDCFMRALPYAYAPCRENLERCGNSISPASAVEVGIYSGTAIAGDSFPSAIGEKIFGDDQSRRSESCRESSVVVGIGGER